MEPVRLAAGELRDPVLLLEAEDELVADVVGSVEPVEPEGQGGRLLAADKEQPRLDVVGPARVVPLAQLELPRLARRDPVLERPGERGRVPA